MLKGFPYVFFIYADFFSSKYKISRILLISTDCMFEHAVTHWQVLLCCSKCIGWIFKKLPFVIHRLVNFVVILVVDPKKSVIITSSEPCIIFPISLLQSHGQSHVIITSPESCIIFPISLLPRHCQAHVIITSPESCIIFPISLLPRHCQAHVIVTSPESCIIFPISLVQSHGQSHVIVTSPESCIIFPISLLQRHGQSHVIFTSLESCIIFPISLLQRHCQSHVIVTSPESCIIFPISLLQRHGQSHVIVTSPESCIIFPISLLQRHGQSHVIVTSPESCIIFPISLLQSHGQSHVIYPPWESQGIQNCVSLQEWSHSAIKKADHIVLVDSVEAKQQFHSFTETEVFSCESSVSETSQLFKLALDHFVVDPANKDKVIMLHFTEECSGWAHLKDPTKMRLPDQFPDLLRRIHNLSEEQAKSYMVSYEEDFIDCLF